MFLGRWIYKYFLLQEKEGFNDARGTVIWDIFDLLNKIPRDEAINL